MATGTAANARMACPLCRRGSPATAVAQAFGRVGGYVKQSAFQAQGRSLACSREIDQLDPHAPRDIEDPLVPIELAVDDPLDPGVGDHLEAGPAGAGARVDISPFDPDPIAGSLQDRIRLGVDGGDAVPVLQHVTYLIAV